MKRRGCSRCGNFVMSLDQAKWRVQNALKAVEKHPTNENREKVAQAQAAFKTAKKLHAEHMEGHNGKSRPGEDGVGTEAASVESSPPAGNADRIHLDPKEGA